MRRITGSLLLALLAGCGAESDTSVEATPAGSYLYVWSGDEDEKDSDFLAIVDADPNSPRYGATVATLPVGDTALMPHHSEYESPPDHQLFLNGWKAGKSFVADLTDPLKPRLGGRFAGLGGYTYPHSFARLDNGHRLATFQSSSPQYGPLGGLVEIDAKGGFVRGTPSKTADMPDDLNWPYSLAVDTARNLVITTSSDMGMPPWDQWQLHDTRHVQLWGLEDLSLKATLSLPEAPAGGRNHLWPAEPRLLEDGTVMVNTFACGLYRLTGLDGDTPAAEWVYSFPGGTDLSDMCAVPVVIDHYWVQTAAAINGLIVLDMTDPAEPREVSRLELPHEFHMPHWLAADRSSDRLILTGDSNSWALMLRFDAKTGKLAIDEKFRDPDTKRLGARFDRTDWPHGKTGKAIIHGAVFR